jgi:GAF domain-containing protein
VPGERHLRILARLSAHGDSDSGTAGLCAVAAEVSAMTGAGIMLMSTDSPMGSFCTSNDVSTVIEELQFSLGEGPCVDAHTLGRPVLEPDLADPAVVRWLAFSPPALAAGVRAVFGFPLQMGAVRFGALNLYRDQPGPLSDDQHADLLVMASVAAQSVLATQSRDFSHGSDAPEVGADFHLIVHQASGMVAAQLGISVGNAFVRLRAHAFSHDLPLTGVADAVVARQLRFDSVGTP